MKERKSITRTHARELESKITPAVKVLSSYVHKTSNVPDELIGYKLPAGEFEKNGYKVQLQIWAVYSKKHKIKTNEVVPVINKWAVRLRIKLFAKIKQLIDWSSK